MKDLPLLAPCGLLATCDSPLVARENHSLFAFAFAVWPKLFWLRGCWAVAVAVVLSLLFAPCSASEPSIHLEDFRSRKVTTTYSGQGEFRIGQLDTGVRGSCVGRGSWVVAWRWAGHVGTSHIPHHASRITHSRAVQAVSLVPFTALEYIQSKLSTRSRSIWMWHSSISFFVQCSVLVYLSESFVTLPLGPGCCWGGGGEGVGLWPLPSFPCFLDAILLGEL